MSRFFPIMIWVHKEQATLINAQSHKYKGTRQNSLWQNTIKSIKLFRFSTFYVFLDFWHKSKKRLIKKQCKNILKKCKQTNKNFQIKLASQQKAHNQAKSQNIGSINAWTCCNAYAWIPFFTHTSLEFGVISLADYVRLLRISNLLVKLVKQLVNASIILITSLTPGSPSWPFD